MQKNRWITMGDPKKLKSKFSRPRKPWDSTRLEEERKLKEDYGLKNKKELWMTEKMLKKKRQNARKLLALELEKRLKREKELLDSLKAIGILKGNAILDDVLGLKIEEFLERRLETIIWRKGMANTPKQARQFIVHGHIAINGKKVKTPSCIVKAEEESKITYYKKALKLTTEKPTKEIKKDFKQSSFEEKVFKIEEKKKGTPIEKKEKVEVKEKPKEIKKEKIDEKKEEKKTEKPVKEEKKVEEKPIEKKEQKTEEKPKEGDKKWAKKE